jgi:hypothetical protein
VRRLLQNQTKLVAEPLFHQTSLGRMSRCSPLSHAGLGSEFILLEAVSRALGDGHFDGMPTRPFGSVNAGASGRISILWKPVNFRVCRFRTNPERLARFEREGSALRPFTDDVDDLWLSLASYHRLVRHDMPTKTCT